VTFIWTRLFNLLHTTITFHHFFTVLLWAQKILSSTFSSIVFFCPSDRSHSYLVFRVPLIIITVNYSYYYSIPDFFTYRFLCCSFISFRFYILVTCDRLSWPALWSTFRRTLNFLVLICLDLLTAVWGGCGSHFRLQWRDCQTSLQPWRTPCWLAAATSPWGYRGRCPLCLSPIRQSQGTELSGVRYFRRSTTCSWTDVRQKPENYQRWTFRLKFFYLFHIQDETAGQIKGSGRFPTSRVCAWFLISYTDNK